MLKTNDMQKFFSRMLKENIWGIPAQYLSIYLYIYIGSGCGRVVQGAGRKAKRMVLQCINGVSSNPVEERTKI